MGNIKKEITYFEFCGEANTEKVLELAKKRCEESGIKKVIIASETGRSALKALKIFQCSDIKILF